MQNADAIRAELYDLIAQRNGSLIPYFAADMDNKSQSWQTLAFKTCIDVKTHLASLPPNSSIIAKPAPIGIGIGQFVVA